MDEGHFCDLKSYRISPSKLTKSISSFANAEGGELFIGVEDSPRKWHGFENQEAANGHLQALERLFPLGADFDYQFLRAADE
ncbi:MAG: ATP-binding protein, partial [Pseudobacteriovorax sp.]|nr:ATP-binding protein [Pseudobacteriovorax sp.]